MAKIQNDYIERVYAGWLGKVIGIRHGSNIEGWTYEKIEKVYGEIKGYLFDFKNFAADDDSNGPVFFLRALTDYTHTRDMTAEQIGQTWLNYAPYEHGFYWWGGYGKSTEHTAYLNLRNGIIAPRSGSIEQNGAAVAEQIGGQIFIDVWGLIVPGNYELAAEYAQKAASVSHDGNGIYGGMFIAACISAAFKENDITEIIDKGLSVIPYDCAYAAMARDILRFHKENPDNWRDCFKFVKANYGYDRYPGVCHIIPNSAVILLSLLYGEGEFSKTINICNMCGWDTDCNVANVGTILGVKNGLKGIDESWRKPINDFLACSSVIGSLNILENAGFAAYIAGLGYKIAGEEPPAEWRDILNGKAPQFHFELPGSTHAFRISAGDNPNAMTMLQQTQEAARSGKGSLKIMARPVSAGDDVRAYYKTYYRPADFNDSRYDPSFSPVIYPGQTIRGSVMVPAGSEAKIRACLYIKEGNTGEFFSSEPIRLQEGVWADLEYTIPELRGACIEEAGIKLMPENGWNSTVLAYLDDFSFAGSPCYTLDFKNERTEVWNGIHQEVSQFTYLKGIWKLEDGELSGSCADFGEAYTGGYSWEDYSFEATLIPKIGQYHNLNFRVQGAIRSYALGLAPDNRLVLYKNENGYRILKEIPYRWECLKEYRLKVIARGSRFVVMEGENILFEYNDSENPYLKGQIGFSVREGSHCHFSEFTVSRV